jgi:hypothetical protein
MRLRTKAPGLNHQTAPQYDRQLVRKARVKHTDIQRTDSSPLSVRSLKSIAASSQLTA